MRTRFWRIFLCLSLILTSVDVYALKHIHFHLHRSSHTVKAVKRTHHSREYAKRTPELPIITTFSGVTGDPETTVNQTIISFMRANRVPGVAVELYVHGKPYSYNFGYANINTRAKVTDNTIFDLGSVTKLFTSLLMAMEINAGKMHLFDPITKYVPVSNPNAPIHQVSLEDLGTHTASLAYNLPRNIKDQETLLKLLARWRPIYPVGSHWAYSNFGIGLIGAALVNVTHESYDQMYRDRILIPLRMNPIAFVAPGYLQSLLAQGYDPSGVIEPDSQLDFLPASWAMKATGHDMLQFLAAAIGLPGTPRDILAAMRLSQTPIVITPNMEQGLGWQIHILTGNLYHMLHNPSAMPIGPFPITKISANTRAFNSTRLIDKTGSWDGFRAYIAVLPSHQSGIVILVNRGVSNGAIVNAGRTILFKMAGINSAP